MIPPRAPEPFAARSIFLLGFLTLFLELTLIRYLAANIWNLGYFPNLVLIGAFVGMGLGFVLHHRVSPARSAALFEGSAVLLASLVAFVYAIHPSVPGFAQWQGRIGGELYFTASPGGVATGLGWFAAWFLGVVATFALLSQRTAKLFAQLPPLRAYTLDIGGSCCGILAFMLASWLHLPAFAWFVVVLAGYLVAAAPRRGPRRWLVAVPLFSTLVVAQLEDATLLGDPAYRGPLEVAWSPYQKLEVISDGARTFIFANGVGHQVMLPPAALGASFYQAPHEIRRRAGVAPYRDVLILGAGSGNDVATALANGAEHVDAVEIDPVIASLGREHHLAHAYADPRVTLTIDDGRAFMQRTHRRYDLVVFALTDSLVKVSSMSQLRLENFLFTEESIARAFSLLSESGDVVLYNYYRAPWLIDKLAAMIERATGKPAQIVSRNDDFIIFMVGRKSSDPGPGASRMASSAAASIDTPTDDWPFLYLERRGVPALYLEVLGGFAVVLLVILLGVERTTRGTEAQSAEPGQLLVKFAFLLMGTAFLLLETKSIIQFSLLFGTTWVNSSLVFLAVLLLVLAANAAATVLPDEAARAAAVVYGLLVASCLITLFFPLAGLLRIESGLARFVVASVMTFSPIFFANLLFSISLRTAKVPERVFGWNLIGATLGGLVEYASMKIGYAALGWVVIGCYTACFFLLMAARPRSSPASPMPVGA